MDSNRPIMHKYYSGLATATRRFEGLFVPFDEIEEDLLLPKATPLSPADLFPKRTCKILTKMSLGSERTE